jgi:hypothetical protein
VHCGSAPVGPRRHGSFVVAEYHWIATSPVFRCGAS